RYVYIPLYSPELNPNEQFLSVVKSEVKRNTFLEKVTLMTRNSEACNGLYLDDFLRALFLILRDALLMASARRGYKATKRERERERERERTPKPKKGPPGQKKKGPPGQKKKDPPSTSMRKKRLRRRLQSLHGIHVSSGIKGSKPGLKDNHSLFDQQDASTITLYSCPSHTKLL
ncbi:hypothetical protein BDB00DRAFT_888650, partial [Zychaea mexicana]|uniref:uncharacterized protein n=1 Tax=Zychaea mexicana TaxID=64656 RepID=UPI0022FE4F06